MATLRAEADQFKAKARKLTRKLKNSTATTRSFDFFKSPTGNISCYMDRSSGVRCDIRKKSWTAPPQPTSCEVDWGFGLTVNEGRGKFVCAGDTVINSAAPTLEYGAKSVRGSFSCSSFETAMICTNSSTGHGFKLSKTSNSRF